MGNLARLCGQDAKTFYWEIALYNSTEVKITHAKGDVFNAQRRHLIAKPTPA